MPDERMVHVASADGDDQGDEGHQTNEPDENAEASALISARPTTA